MGWERLGWKGVSVLHLVPVDTQSWGEQGEEAGRVAGTWQGAGDCPGNGKMPLPVSSIPRMES